ncbi:peroxiredoxin [Amphibiibacter pelophylacis]|uniref:Peroxiredoxin n=1 Tax=Amphibiibacter pelophylacis TaxID=1799477 RepID=A0ACC6P158_9BURK
MIQVGDSLPAVTIAEYINEAREGCTLGPNPFSTADEAKGKRIALFAVPGAFTPTCSAKHAPGYVELADELRAAGVDEIWCVSVNDAFVMNAWGEDMKVGGAIRMLGDGSADFAKATGLTLDLTSRGLGLRSNRYSMLIDDGRIVALNNEAPGAFDVSDAATLLKQAQEHKKA